MPTSRSSAAAAPSSAGSRPPSCGRTPPPTGACDGSSCTRPGWRREPDAAAARALANRRAPRKTCRGPKDRKKTPRGDPTVRIAFSFAAAGLAAALVPLAASAQPCTHTIGVVVELTGPGRTIRPGGREIRRARLQGIERGGRRRRLPARHGPARLAEPGLRRGRPGAPARRPQARAGDHRRHHLVRVAAGPDLGYGARERRADLARLVLADADPDRPGGQGERHLLPHHHLGRAAGHRGGEIRPRPGHQVARDHPRQQRFRRQHGGRVPQGLRGARRQDHHRRRPTTRARPPTRPR